ncbi:arsenate reductase/protein-tyrosine-phosphatase family protein [Leifsonia sp. RAF41]|uniref:arsenate reductase/protein-tyrosine-phosphatase family protein n=1 Tax=Leifsonia sp. RAF41 TaxID=3233056 RepID=UPI003F94CD8D
MPTPGSEPANILVVCTGNICRSPYMQFTLTAALAAAGVDDIVVASAGTHAVPDSGVAPHMAALLRADGLDVDGYATRQLTAAMVADADIVLTAERAHRKQVVLLDPRALGRTFTLLQFSRLLPVATASGRHRAEQSAKTRLKTLIERCVAARGTVGPGGSGDDVADPWGFAPDAYRRSAEQMRPALYTVADALVPRGIGSII